MPSPPALPPSPSRPPLTPASPIAPVSSLTPLQRLSAQLSSVYRRTYPASAAIDGNKRTLCASRAEQNAWLSVRVAAGTSVEHVAIYNRGDFAAYQEWLSPFEVYVGASAGDVSTSAIRCGGVNAVPAGPGPFSVVCGGAVGAYVTLRLVGRVRYLTIAELEVFGVAGQGTSVVQPDLSTRNDQSSVSPLSIDTNQTLAASVLSGTTDGGGSRAWLTSVIVVFLLCMLGLVIACYCGAFRKPLPRTTKRIQQSSSNVLHVRVAVRRKPSDFPSLDRHSVWADIEREDLHHASDLHARHSVRTDTYPALEA